MMAEDLTKASIRRETKRILNKIVANEDGCKFEYEVLDKVLREKYPEYFRGKQITV